MRPTVVWHCAPWLHLCTCSNLAKLVVSLQTIFGNGSCTRLLKKHCFEAGWEYVVLGHSAPINKKSHKQRVALSEVSDVLLTGSFQKSG